MTKGGYDLDGLNQELYAIPKQVMGNLEDAKELKKIQGQFFKNVYKLLIDKEKGPRLYLFLYAIDPEQICAPSGFLHAHDGGRKAVRG